MMIKRVLFFCAAALIPITAVVVFVVVLNSKYDKCNQFEPPMRLDITGGTEDITVSWDHTPPNKECGVFYKLQYTLEDEEEKEVYIDGTSWTFPRPKVCSVSYFRVWAINKAGKQSDNSAARTYDEMPTEADVGDIKFSPSDAGLVVTWNRPTGLDNCVISYNIYYITDLRELNAHHNITYSENFIVPDNSYCFRVYFYMFVYAFSYYVSGSIKSDTYINNLEEPQDLELTSLTTENILVASWREHDKQDLCDIEYKVLYEYTDFNQIYISREPRINLDIAYCTLATVQVSTVRNSDESNAATATHLEEEPDSLGPVQNLMVNITEENEAIISWNPPEHASQCTNLEYIVRARNDETQDNETCAGKVTCSLSLSDFCPTTTFTVREILDITQESSIQFTC